MLGAAQLAAIVEAVEPGATLESSREVVGGLSSAMTEVRIRRLDGSNHRLAIRRSREPDAARHTLSIGTEFSLLVALHALGVAVARPRWFDESNRIVDRELAVLDWIDGEPNVSTDDPVTVGREYARVLTEIHALEIDGTQPPFSDLPTHRSVAERFLTPPDRPLDDTLDEGAIRAALHDVWPPPTGIDRLLHGDYFPGNVLWWEGTIRAVIDWEEAAVGDPLADVATTRLDLRWDHGLAAAEAFTDAYFERSAVDPTPLPVWDLVAALRPMTQISRWAADGVDLGFAHVDASSMRADHHAFVTAALARLP